MDFPPSIWSSDLPEYDPLMKLTLSQIEAYERDGFLSGLRVVPTDQARQYQLAYDQLESELGRDKCALGLLDRHFDQRFIWDIATTPNVLDVVESLIGPDILLLATHFFCKYGPPDRFVAWHQDVTYWGLEPAESITAWYALDDSDTGNGCMRAIPGTHKRDIVEHGKSGTGKNLLSVDQEIAVTDEDEKNAVDLVMKAGEISLHDGKVFHGSLPNRSTRRRCGLTLRYIAPHVKQVVVHPGQRPYKPILVRGKDRQQHFGTTARPFELVQV